MEPSAPHPVRNGSGRAGPILFFIILGLIVAAILAFILFHPRPNGSSTLTGPDAHSASPADAATIHQVLTVAASRDDIVAIDAVLRQLGLSRCTLPEALEFYRPTWTGMTHTAVSRLWMASQGWTRPIESQKAD